MVVKTLFIDPMTILSPPCILLANTSDKRRCEQTEELGPNMDTYAILRVYATLISVFSEKLGRQM